MCFVRTTNSFKIKNERSLFISRIIIIFTINHKYDNDAHKNFIYTMILMSTPNQMSFDFLFGTHIINELFSSVVAVSVLILVLKIWKGEKMQSHDNSTFFCFLFKHSVLHSFCSRHQKINCWLIIINVHHLWELLHSRLILRSATSLAYWTTKSG